MIKKFSYIFILLIFNIVFIKSEYTQEIFDCITKEKCQEKYISCANDKECTHYMN